MENKKYWRKSMAILLTFVLVVSMLFIYALPVFAYTWSFYFPITTIDTTGTSRTYVPVLLGVNGSAFYTSGYILSTGLNTGMMIGATDIPFMVGTTQIATVIPSLSMYSTSELKFYTGYLPAQTGFPIITGIDGYLTQSDDASMEWGTNGTMTVSGYINTTNGTANKYIFIKPAAIACSVDYYTSGRIGLYVPNGSDLQYTAAGTQYCNKAAGVVAPAGGNITIDAWFYISALTGSIQTIIACGDTATFADWILAVTNTQHIYFSVGNAAAGATAALWNQTGNVSLNQWHFVTAVYDSSATTRTRVYIDGAEVAGVDVGGGGNINQPNTHLAVGAAKNAGAYAFYFNGYIDEVRVTQGVRTLANHIVAYNEGWGIEFTADASTTSLWHFNEGAGNPNDTMGNNNLTRQNNPTWSTTSPVGIIALSVSGIASGDYVLTASLVGGTLSLVVNGTSNTTAYGFSIKNSSSNWTWMANNSMPYINYVTENTSTGQVLWYQPVTMVDDTTVPDRSGNGNDGTIVWGTNTGLNIYYGVVVSYISATPAVGSVSGNYSPPQLTLSSGWFGTGSVSSENFWSAFTSMSTDAGMNAKAILMFVAVGVAMVLGMIVFRSSNSVLISSILIAGVLYFFSEMSIIPFALVFIFLLISAGIMYLVRLM